ncbi:hypothetical protein PY257_12770 [Ramlibacter sp. H39-3-26]|uniref:hypothetical protein n=1 Tax=Curvibacter soli TaxID=3031331 RepID=UPI0023DCCBA5|nr:hypothetical protein [Ramlibacter sp. H39-3-26]MDF1486042.1 hypothetical protein [Ramlibacter sp. H39-3-26]
MKMIAGDHAATAEAAKEASAGGAGRGGGADGIHLCSVDAGRVRFPPVALAEALALALVAVGVVRMAVLECERAVLRRLGLLAEPEAAPWMTLIRLAQTRVRSQRRHKALRVDGACFVQVLSH